MLPSKSLFNETMHKMGLLEKIFIIDTEKICRNHIDEIVEKLFKEYPFVTIRCSSKSRRIGLPYLVRVTRQYYYLSIEDFISKLERFREEYRDIKLLIHGTFSPVAGGIITSDEIIGVFGDPVGLLRYGDVHFKIKLCKDYFTLTDSTTFYSFFNNNVKIVSITTSMKDKILSMLLSKRETIRDLFFKVIDLFSLEEIIDNICIYFLMYSNGKLSFFNITTINEDNKDKNTNIIQRVRERENVLIVSYEEIRKNYEGVLLEIMKNKPRKVLIRGGRLGYLSHFSIILRELGIELEFE